MPDRSKYPIFHEYYEVAESVEVVAELAGEPTHIRIEALLHVDAGKYQTRAYKLEDVTIQTNGKPLNTRLWIDYDLPWTDSATADGAIAQALSFLQQRCG
jgi:hypothetical protein